MDIRIQCFKLLGAGTATIGLGLSMGNTTWFTNTKIYFYFQNKTIFILVVDFVRLLKSMNQIQYIHLLLII